MGNRPLLAALAAGVMVGSVTLGTGFFTDDYVHLLTLSGGETPGAPFDLFCFGRGDAEGLRPFIASGQMPWFTLPELKIWFFRPLTSATMWLDHTLFGNAGAWFHMHSLLWYLAAISCAWLLFRRALSPAIAAWALLLFALDAGHAVPVAWWSNRGALVAGVPALLGLAAHLRWREDGWKPGLPFSLLGYALGLLGGEAALGILGYLFAYELFGRGRDRAWGRRCAALLPAALLCAGYLALYWWLGRGAYGSGGYLDPVREPLRFLAEAPGYFFGAVATQFLLLQRELAAGLPLPWIGVCMLAVLAALAFALRAHANRGLAWLALGAALSCIPVLTGAASARMLFFPSLGTAAVVAFLIHAGWRQAGRSAFLFRAAAGVLLLLHVVLAPLFWIAAGALVAEMSRQANAALETLPLDDATAPRKQLIVLTQPDPLVAMFGSMMRAAQGHAAPRAWWSLGLGRNKVRVLRSGQRRIEVEFLSAPVLKDGFEQTFRNVRHGFSAGDQVPLDGLLITILAVDLGRPTRIALDFESDPASGHYVFAHWGAGRYELWTLPAVAQEVVLDHGAEFPVWFAGPGAAGTPAFVTPRMHREAANMLRCPHI